MKEQKGEGTCSFHPIVDDSTVAAIVTQGLVQYLFNGKAAILFLSDQIGADAVQYGLGFCKAIKSSIFSVSLEELVVVECLQYFISVSDIVHEICRQLRVYPKPQMTEKHYILKYLVAYAHADFSTFVMYKKDNNIFFPNQFCGPDIAVIYNDIVYMIQIDSSSECSKQQLVNACHTTDFNFFYCNNSTKTVLSGFEDERKEMLDVLELKVIRRVLCSVSPATDMENDVQLLNETTQPDFFDCLGTGLWGLLKE
ncbi:hypothetical protein BDR26DRAFT_864058 [Obelidium mucronatum]|nr:hypothetical protein BDR26DRAFT_864058 [Obelidium mucronatum]